MSFYKGKNIKIKHSVNRTSTPLNRYDLYDNKKYIGTIENFIGTENRISYLFVEEKYRLKGYGKILVNHMIDELKDNNHKFIQVTSASSASLFYEKVGFYKIENRYLKWILGLDEGVTHYKSI